MILREWRRKTYFQISVLKVSSIHGSVWIFRLNFPPSPRTADSKLYVFGCTAMFCGTQAESRQQKENNRVRISQNAFSNWFLYHLCPSHMDMLHVKWKLVFYFCFLVNTTRWQLYPTCPEKEIKNTVNYSARCTSFKMPVATGLSKLEEIFIRRPSTSLHHPFKQRQGTGSST